VDLLRGKANTSHRYHYSHLEARRRRRSTVAACRDLTQDVNYCIVRHMHRYHTWRMLVGARFCGMCSFSTWPRKTRSFYIEAEAVEPLYGAAIADIMPWQHRLNLEILKVRSVHSTVSL